MFKNHKIKFVLAFSIIFFLFVGIIDSSNIAFAKNNKDPVKGAIYTTNKDGTEQNQNHYASKEDVYLHVNKNNFSEGDYYIRIIGHKDEVLGVSEGLHSITNGDNSVYKLWDLVSFEDENGEKVQGYKDTTNPGGKYKLEISKSQDFHPSVTKSDNFKIDKSNTSDDKENPKTPEESNDTNDTDKGNGEDDNNKDVDNDGNIDNDNNKDDSGNIDNGENKDNDDNSKPSDNDKPEGSENPSEEKPDDTKKPQEPNTPVEPKEEPQVPKEPNYSNDHEYDNLPDELEKPDKSEEPEKSKEETNEADKLDELDEPEVIIEIEDNEIPMGIVDIEEKPAEKPEVETEEAEEPEEIIEIQDEETPKSAPETLPKTGEAIPYLNYIMGGLLITIGSFLKKFNK